jgi:hypothetical protein
VDQIDGHAPDIIGDFHCTHIKEATHEGVTDTFGVLAHFTGSFVHGATLQDLQHIPRLPGEGLTCQIHRTDEFELLDFRLEIVNPCLAWIRLEPFKHRARRRLGYNQQLSLAHTGYHGFSDALMHILKEGT